MNGLPSDHPANRGRPFRGTFPERSPEERAEKQAALKARQADEHAQRRAMAPGGRLRGLKAVVDRIDADRLRGGGDPTIPDEITDPRSLAQQILTPKPGKMTGWGIDPDRSERYDQ